MGEGWVQQMMMVLIAGALFLYGVVTTVILVRYAKKLLDFDELFILFSHDIETNVKYFRKLLSTPLYSNSPEILEAQRNMVFIEKRLSEYGRRIEEVTLIEKKEDKTEKPNPPVLA